MGSLEHESLQKAGLQILQTDAVSVTSRTLATQEIVAGPAYKRIKIASSGCEVHEERTEEGAMPPSFRTVMESLEHESLQRAGLQILQTDAISVTSRTLATQEIVAGPANKGIKIASSGCEVHEERTEEGAPSRGSLHRRPVGQWDQWDRTQ
ncbi:hypothetical protein HKX48_003797 [Thoreauomyces humboldtii]|nr:hypothetical protein HKX48_003797 [Thoreauomyces humboldtii]